MRLFSRSIASFVVTAVVLGSGYALEASSAGASSVPAIPIAKAPVQVVTTTMGDVDYRVVGSGRPLVLVTGLGASIDDWAPIFVNALATHFQVYVFDNAGVGQTAALPSPLTIQEMAGQTSAFLSALHVGRCAVLGWSMGGMVAQALAIEHPHQVTKLILAATQAGTGKAIPPSAAFQAEASSTNPLVVLNILFPKSQAL